MRRFLLDTNILLGLTRKAPWANWAYSHFDLGSPAVGAIASSVNKSVDNNRVDS